MTQPRPTAPEMLEAVRTFLTDELLPTLDGRLRFHTRVAANALETIERELAAGPAAIDAEHQRLLAMLGGPASGLDDTGDPGDDTGRDDTDLGDASAEALSRELAGRIRVGTIDIDDPLLLDHLTRTARADVAIANPRWLEAADE